MGNLAETKCQKTAEEKKLATREKFEGTFNGTKAKR
jgi:hypothetical protein